TGMHLAIGIFMGILYFSLVMIAVDMILISDRSWIRAAEWIRGRRGGAESESDPSSPIVI
ncbi:hypothetical protein, partial [Aeromicrobium sp.]|uniref:hypothetical protein n=1 Tax=Aeromicrobium sp. TaxID=1871063 RepID=UPI00198CEA9C